MLHRTYQRSQIVNFYELTEDQQQQAIDLTDQEHAEQDSYVFWKGGDQIEILPLSMFMRNEKGKLPHGTYGLSYFSAYQIVLNRTGEEATVIYCHW